MDQKLDTFLSRLPEGKTVVVHTIQLSDGTIVTRTDEELRREADRLKRGEGRP